MQDRIQDFKMAFEWDVHQYECSIRVVFCYEQLKNFFNAYFS